MNKIIKFIHMNKYEKYRSIVRNLYSHLNKNKFGSIGKKSYFLKPDFVSGTQYIYMKDDVGIWNNARVEIIDYWEGKQFNPKLIIGNHVNIGQDLHLTVAERVEIEDNVVCTARVTITDIKHVTKDINTRVLKQPILTQPVHICEGAFIGVNSTVLPGVTIGKHAVIGANSVVTRDVPDYATVVGTPARVIKKANIENIK